MTTLLFALIGGAYAADAEFSLEMGSLAVTDPGFRMYSNGGALPSRGVRAGVGINDNFSVIADYQHAGRGASVSYNGVGGTAFNSAFRADELSLGAKAGFGVRDIVFPYVSVSALGVLGESRLDANTADALHDPTQQVAHGFSPGGVAMAGVEGRIPQNGAPFTFGAYLEMGYAVVAPIDFGEQGSLTVGGFAARGGVGIRF